MRCTNETSRGIFCGREIEDADDLYCPDCTSDILSFPIEPLKDRNGRQRAFMAHKPTCKGVYTGNSSVMKIRKLER